MKTFVEYAQGYVRNQPNTTTRYTHIIGISLITLALMILLGFVHIVIPRVISINVAYIGTLVLLVYYFRLQWLLALALTPLFVLMLWIAHFFSAEGPSTFSLWSFFIILLFGVLLELIGHYLENNLSRLTKNLDEIIFAPLFLMAELFYQFGRLQDLHDEIYGKESPEEKKKGKE